MSFTVHDSYPYPALRWLWLSALIIVLDQLSKALITAHMHLFDTIHITPWLDLMLLHNPGAAFSFLSHAPGWQRWFFIALGLIVTLVIVIWLRRMPRRGKHWQACALSLILGGALGNVIDRINYGYVIDFIHLHYHAWSWPAFNVADSAIVIGATMIVIESLWRSRRQAPKPEESSPERPAD